MRTRLFEVNQMLKFLSYAITFVAVTAGASIPGWAFDSSSVGDWTVSRSSDGLCGAVARVMQKRTLFMIVEPDEGNSGGFAIVSLDSAALVGQETKIDLTLGTKPQSRQAFIIPDSQSLALYVPYDVAGEMNLIPDQVIVEARVEGKIVFSMALTDFKAAKALFDACMAEPKPKP
jgi:hypothetical protein